MKILIVTMWMLCGVSVNYIIIILFFIFLKKFLS